MVILVSARSFFVPMCSLRPESAAVRSHAFSAVFSLLEPSFGGLDTMLREQLAEFEPETFSKGMGVSLRVRDLRLRVGQHRAACAEGIWC